MAKFNLVNISRLHRYFDLLYIFKINKHLVDSGAFEPLITSSSASPLFTRLRAPLKPYSVHGSGSAMLQYIYSACNIPVSGTYLLTKPNEAVCMCCCVAEKTLAQRTAEQSGSG